MSTYDSYKRKIERMKDELHDRLMVALERRELTEYIMSSINSFFRRHKLTSGAYDFNMKSLSAAEYQAILNDAKSTMKAIDEACEEDSFKLHRV